MEQSSPLVKATKVKQSKKPTAKGKKNAPNLSKNKNKETKKKQNLQTKKIYLLLT